VADRVTAVLGLAGLARRGGNLVVGRDAVREAVRHRSVSLVVLATDAGAALVREMERLAMEAQVPVLRIGTRDRLGKAVGKARVAVSAFTDAGLAEAAQTAAENQSFVRRQV